MKQHGFAAAAFLSIAVAGASCGSAGREAGPVVVRPGAPGEVTRTVRGVEPADSERTPRYTEADVRFMRDMIAHHEQALVMTKLAPARSSRPDMQLLARRIDASQATEIALLHRWLEVRGEGRSDGHAQHAASYDHGSMPGMLTAEELQRLEAAAGEEFDRLFLDLMIRHHEGALTMVAALLSTDGAGQEPEVFRFAAHVDADQRAEISRMRRMQTAMSQRGSE